MSSPAQGQLAPDGAQEQLANAGQPAAKTQRDHLIVKASVIGIVGNLLLSAFKMLVGFISGSIAIILDGVNNATDVMASVVTIVGTKLAARRPDKKHPFGYGRVEYLTSVAIAVIILAAGAISLKESVDKIVTPGEPSYSTLAITIIVVAIIAKIGLGLVFKHYGDKTKSEALVASGVDSNNDAVLSAGTLVVALFQNLWGINIDGAVGLIISLVVCKTGLDVLRDSLAPIIGTPEDKEQVERIRTCVRKYPEVGGVHDIIIDNYGPNKVIGSARIQVRDDMTAKEASELTRQIAKALQEDSGVIMNIGIYTENTSDEFKPMHAKLEELANADPDVHGIHAFYVDRGKKTCFFDLEVDVSANAAEVERRVVSAMQRVYPDYTFDVQVDTDYEE